MLTTILLSWTVGGTFCGLLRGPVFFPLEEQGVLSREVWAEMLPFPGRIACKGDAGLLCPCMHTRERCKQFSKCLEQ